MRKTSKKEFKVKSYLQSDDKTFSLLSYFFGLFYRTIIPLFLLLMIINFWGKLLVTAILFVFLIFFSVFQFEVSE